MSRIIALKGRRNSGKTTTINLLPNILLANGYSRVAGMYQNHGSDFLDVFENGIQRVGVTSSGDTYDLVHDRLTDLINSKCDVCVCACRTSGGTHTAIYNFTGYTSHFEKKTYAGTPAQEPIVNAADANNLFSLI
ncbi:MAG: hypothetical protein EOO19_09440 [Chryseobacterium sp.]|nr:MAG: hypothetical protein EOO19_09440 [Chryseobacterium sp.]